eukprot:s460_g6.t1
MGKWYWWKQSDGEWVRVEWWHGHYWMLENGRWVEWRDSTTQPKAPIPAPLNLGPPPKPTGDPPKDAGPPKAAAPKPGPPPKKRVPPPPKGSPPPNATEPPGPPMPAAPGPVPLPVGPVPGPAEGLTAKTTTTKKPCSWTYGKVLRCERWQVREQGD